MENKPTYRLFLIHLESETNLNIYVQILSLYSEKKLDLKQGGPSCVFLLAKNSFTFGLKGQKDPYITTV
jgi:hypothetical protein